MSCGIVISSKEIHLLKFKENINTTVFIKQNERVHFMFDWDGNGKIDGVDDYIDYKVYKDVTSGNNNDGCLSAGCSGGFWIGLAVVLVLLFIIGSIGASCDNSKSRYYGYATSSYRTSNSYSSKNYNSSSNKSNTSSSKSYNSSSKKSSSSSSKSPSSKTSYSKSYSSSKKSSKNDEYNAKDYVDPEDFYDDHYDDFFDYEDAEDYYYEHSD